jgi:hypothetical protein
LLQAAEIAAAAAVLSRPAQTNSFGRFKSVAQEPKSLPLVLTVPAQAAAAAQLSSTFANADVNMISSRRSGRVPKQDTPSVTATSTTTATDPLPATALVQSFNNQSTVNRSSRFAQRAPEQLSAPHRNDLPREAPKVNADLLNAFSAEWASASDEVAKQQRRARFFANLSCLSTYDSYSKHFFSFESDVPHAKLLGTNVRCLLDCRRRRCRHTLRWASYSNNMNNTSKHVTLAYRRAATSLNQALASLPLDAES